MLVTGKVVTVSLKSNCGRVIDPVLLTQSKQFKVTNLLNRINNIDALKWISICFKSSVKDVSFIPFSSSCHIRD